MKVSELIREDCRRRYKVKIRGEWSKVASSVKKKGKTGSISGQ